jgi:hypothetical protein
MIILAKVVLFIVGVAVSLVVGNAMLWTLHDIKTEEYCDKYPWWEHGEVVPTHYDNFYLTPGHCEAD